MKKPQLAPGDRNVAWEGICPADWRLVPLKYQTTINGHTLGEDTPPGYAFRYIDISSVDSNGAITGAEPLTFETAPSRARRRLKHGDVFVSTVRTYLKAIGFNHEADANLVCSTGFATLSTKNGLHPKFLYYWVRSSHFVDEIVARSVGVSYPAINASEIGSLPAPHLKRQHQEAIADYLDEKTALVERLIQRKRRLIELLQEKRTALITHAVTKGLNPDVPMKDSGVSWLGTIPAHWTVCPVKYRYEVQLGKMLDSSKITGTHLAPYLRNVDIQWNRINVSDLPTMDFDGDDRKKFLLRTGDLLVCEGGEVGRASIWNDELPECFYQKALHRVRPFAEIDNPKFMYYLLYCSAKTGIFCASGNQNTIDHLTAVQLKNYRFGFPPASEQDDIVNILEEEESRIEALIEKCTLGIDKLNEYRSSLIFHAVSGKTDLRGGALDG